MKPHQDHAQEKATAGNLLNANISEWVQRMEINFHPD